MNWTEQVVLVTGGTGSFGQKFVEIMLREYRPQKLIVFSRDELKQHEMRTAGLDHPSLRYFLGDVRDQQRLERAFAGVTVVVHAAALKQVPACEYNPFEAIQTNINGGKNVIEAAINCGVRRIVALSTDKAVNPINLYGATKLCAEKMFVQANAYAGAQDTRFSCARYGNVVGSRGSVIPIFMEQRTRGRVTITDSRMTRFWITLEDGVRFVIQCLEQMHGGEIFVPENSQHEAAGYGTGHRAGLARSTALESGRGKSCTKSCSLKTRPGMQSIARTCSSFSLRNRGGEKKIGRATLRCLKGSVIPANLIRVGCQRKTSTGW